MPVILEEAVSPRMDEFVNWDHAASPANTAPGDGGAGNVALGADYSGTSPNPTGVCVLSQLDNHPSLMFENPDADDFSFWAMEHYDQSISQPAPGDDELGKDLSTAVATNGLSQDFTPIELWDVPGEPCVHCKEGGYQCKTIQEGNYKGYCTSCVALRCECSFGLASAGPLPTAISFPSNPWPTLGDHPDPIPHDNVSLIAHGIAHSTSVPDLTAWAPTNAQNEQPELVDKTGPVESAQPAPVPAVQPKLAARFSRESVRILKNWVSTHSRHPYPTEDEKEALQRLTGLNKTQISNWLANARRRGKIPVNRSTSPHVRNSWTGTSTVEIPQGRRSGTPSPFDRKMQQVDSIPLQRWANSPPENEPASVTDIARAITSSSSVASSGLNSPYNLTDDGSSRSLFNGSSASSAGTSHSSGGGSFASAFSHGSHGSFGSFSSLGRGRRRRRRRSAQLFGSGSGEDLPSAGKPAAAISGRQGPTKLTAPLKTYQCTFCTETFKTKHDWQRHEKSLHLSLERWICSPQGPVAVNPDTKLASCVFCGEASPTEEHVESHNFTACQERPVGDRTFYRKDHLRQHLKLVHGVKFISWSMDPWKVATPEIRSRCGFCGIVMDTWTFRIDHLADHFKTGRTMADWKGDWGFEDPVLQMVENSIPPYLIHDERNTPLPFTANLIAPQSPRNPYELLIGELAYWLQEQRETGKNPKDSEILVEACRIVFAAKLLEKSNSKSWSWLHDLLMADEICQQKARLSPIRSAADSWMASPRINGKDAIFDACPLEAGLQQFVASRAQLGLTAMNVELQAEAARMLRQMEDEMLSDMNELGAELSLRASLDRYVLDVFVRRIYQSTDWLTAFRERAHLPRLEVITDESRRPLHDPTSIDSALHNEPRLEADLGDFVRKLQDAGEAAPDDATLQSQARLIIYEHEDGWNQTAADDPKWLESFKTRHMPQTHMQAAIASGNSFLKPTRFFLNDTNCYRRLARELTRFVTAATSPNNPTRHVPTDEELQHQARWILYDDDDPWNQTAADNAEWLMRFKRDVGILPTGPGLVIESRAWSVTQGGTGFAPPYCFPMTPRAPFGIAQELHNDPYNNDDYVAIIQPDDTYCKAANKFMQSFTTRYAKPARVFCSRELENGLADFVRESVGSGAPFPDDDALRAKARAIMSRSSSNETPADDEELLGKFKTMMHASLAEGQDESAAQDPSLLDPTSTAMETDLNFAFDEQMDFDSHMESMLQDMDGHASTGLNF